MDLDDLQTHNKMNYEGEDDDDDDNAIITSVRTDDIIQAKDKWKSKHWKYR